MGTLQTRNGIKSTDKCSEYSYQVEVAQKMKATKKGTRDNRRDAVYARQSLDKKDSLSIESQIDKALERADQGAEIYQDKGYSGKNTDRPELQRLKSDIETNKIKRVIVYRLDRISRNIADFYQLYQLMELHRCEFISISEQFETSTPMGRAMMGILIVFAQMERESIQERVKDNYYYRIEEDGRWPGGPAPMGFKNARTKERKPTLEQTPDIEMVKLAYEWYGNDANTSLGQVGRKLYAEGFRSRRESGQFDNVTIARILQNPVYAIADGLLYKYYKTRRAHISSDQSTWDGSTSCHIVGKREGNVNTRKYTSLEEQTVYRTNFQGVIPSSLFIAVQERLASNEKLGRANAPSKMLELAGKVKCAKCGYAIRANNFPHLNCYGRSSLHACNASISLNFYELREKVGVEVQKQLDVVAQKFIDDGIKARKSTHEIEEINAEIERLVNLAAKGTMDIEQVSTAIEERKQRIDEIELSQERNLTFMERAKISISLPLVFDRLNDDEKKSVVNLLIEKILLSENGDIEIIWKI